MISHRKNKLANLSRENRQALGQLALVQGITPAASRFGVTRKTARKWAAQVDRGGAFACFNDPLSEWEQSQFLAQAPQSITESLARVLSRTGIHRSPATLSRFYQRANLPVAEIRLVWYRVPGIRNRIKAVNCFYSMPLKIQTPLGTAHRVQSRIVPFYRERKSDYFLYGGRIFPVAHPRFAIDIAPRIRPNKDRTAWFIQSDHSPVLHVIELYQSDGVSSYCQHRFPFIRANRIISPEEPFTGLLCRRCLPGVFTAYAKKRDLSPLKEDVFQRSGSEIIRNLYSDSSRPIHGLTTLYP